MRFPALYACLSLAAAASAAPSFAKPTPRQGEYVIQDESPRGTYSVDIRPDAHRDYGDEVWIVKGKKRVRLPLHPVLDTDGKNVDDPKVGVLVNTVCFSPDEHWLYVDGKFIHTVNVAYLFHQTRSMHFRPATKVRFDEAAMRFYYDRRGWPRKKIASLCEGPRILRIDHWARDSKRLYFRSTEFAGLWWFDTTTRRFRGPVSHKSVRAAPHRHTARRTTRKK